MTPPRKLLLATLAALACAPATHTDAGPPNIDPGAQGRPPVVITSSDTAVALSPAEILSGRTAQPDAALAAGWMPLEETGVLAFLKAHPDDDGRGVIIGILDSGIDAGVDGLGTTTTGRPKLLDLRDFSEEGRVPLAPLSPAGDTITVAGHRLRGMTALQAEGLTGPWFGGVLLERPLGPPPASDVNGNGTDSDTLPIVVARGADGWVLLADTDGDGSLRGERPIRDYLAAHETFGWHSGAKPSPLTVAANFSETGGAPVLDLFFDTIGHGTHVAGIAAGHDIYGQRGLDGVAPGAYLLGLKIANDALGGISTSFSMVRAMKYAIAFARARKLPLVLNMSFGVGNEAEGRAVIDRAVDSVLAANPDIVFTISAGNDGPGLSTVGFPGSASRALSIGATVPSAYLPVTAAGARRPDQLEYFSSRGGELAKPDLVTPGVAYSTVPRWAVGDEQMSGTSMASPHAAGLAALLVSGLAAADRPIVAQRIGQALMATAQPLADQSALDQGAGLPDVGQAWEWLQAGRTLPAIAVSAGGGAGITAAFHRNGLAAGDTVQLFRLSRTDSAAPVTLHLRSSAAWLGAPDSIVVGAGTVAVPLRYRPQLLREPGLHEGIVTAWSADTLAGPAARMINTVIVPVAADSWHVSAVDVPAGGQRRFFFRADSGRAFAVTLAAAGPTERGSAYLHEPDGMPFPGVGDVPAGSGATAAVLQPDADEVVPGVWEADLLAPPDHPLTADVTIEQSPLRLTTTRRADGIHAGVSNLTGHPLTGAAAMALAGATRTVVVVGQGSETQSIPFRAPDWAGQVEVDLSMDPAQWERFTDLGVTLFDSTGRQVEQSPLNYASGRLDATLPDRHGDLPLVLQLAPAFADSAAAGRWTARVTLRLIGTGTPLASAAAPAGPVSLRLAAAGSPDAARELVFHLPAEPRALGDGFVPLVALLVQTGGRVWLRVAAAPPPAPVLMR